jgi:hypothetical protein
MPPSIEAWALYLWSVSQKFCEPAAHGWKMARLKLLAAEDYARHWMRIEIISCAFLRFSRRIPPISK